MKNNKLARPDGNGKFHLTKEGNNLLYEALLKSTKFLYICEREK
jgi:hypothetical protein